MLMLMSAACVDDVCSPAAGAVAGAAVLWETLERLNDVQRLRLACQLADLQQQQGFKLRPGTWAAQLAAEADR